jgi:hypothetical protein
MRLNGRSSGIPSELLDQVRAGGEPLVARVDEIIAHDTVRASLLVGSIGMKADQSVVIKTAPGMSAFRSLSSAIAGNERAAKLVPADVIAFETAYRYNGNVFAETISARTNDMMRGHVQVITAMARPTKATVNKKGALQSLVITDGLGAKTARASDKVRDFFKWVKSQPWPGGAPGMIIRDHAGFIKKEFFEEGRSTIDSLIEDLEFDEVFSGPNGLIEMIPAWRLPMGRDQVTRDVNPKVEVSGYVGAFTKSFVSKETKGFPGFLPCLVVLSKEDQWEFGANTGKQAMVAAGVQPLDKLPPIPRENLSSAVRQFKGNSPKSINKLYDEPTMAAMAKERAERSPAPKPAERVQNQQQARPAGRPPFGGVRPSLNGSGKTNTPSSSPIPSQGARRFGR